MLKLSIFDRIRLFFTAFFRGLRSADETMLRQANGVDGSAEITQKASAGGVFNDMLRQEETQRVKEMRDRYYRIFKEADKYHVDVRIIGEGDNEVFQAEARKKNLLDYSRHCDVLMREGETLEVIQDNWHMDSGNLIEGLPKLYDYITTLDIKRDGYKTRFDIEKFATKIVVKTIANGRKVVDLYFPTMASQFGKIDAIFISALNKVFQDKPKRVDFFVFDEMDFVTDRAWGKDDICAYAFEDIHYAGLDIYDGQFVASFDCKATMDGVYLAEKYKTEEVDKKYAEHALNDGVTPDIETVERNMNKIDGTQETVSFKL